jgi:hypothetical protein
MKADAVPATVPDSREAAMSTNPRFDAAWKSWLDDNIRRGCTHQSLIDAMIANAFHPNTARSILARHIAGDAFVEDEATAKRRSSSVARNRSSRCSPTC